MWGGHTAPLGAAPPVCPPCHIPPSMTLRYTSEMSDEGAKRASVPHVALSHSIVAPCGGGSEAPEAGRVAPRFATPPPPMGATMPQWG